MKKLRVASVQMDHTPGDKEANFAKIRDFVQQASQQDVELISFPECCIRGYWHLRHLSRQRLVELPEPVFDGPASQQLRSLAMDHKMTVALPMTNVTVIASCTVLSANICPRVRNLPSLIRRPEINTTCHAKSGPVIGAVVLDIH